MKFFLSLLLFVQLSAGYTMHNNEGVVKRSTIKGQIIDASNNEPLSGVVVELASGEKVYTDFDGYFTLTVAAGSYEIKASLASYSETKLRNVKVEDGNEKVLELKLHNTL